MMILTTSIKYLVVFTLFIFMSEISFFKKKNEKKRKKENKMIQGCTEQNIVYNWLSYKTNPCHFKKLFIFL